MPDTFLASDYIRGISPFYSKSYKTKTVRRYFIDKILFSYFCVFFKIGKIRAIYRNFAVLRCKLNGHFRKNLDIFSMFLFTKIITLVHTFLGPFNQWSFLIKCGFLDKFGTGYCPVSFGKTVRPILILIVAVHIKHMY